MLVKKCFIFLYCIDKHSFSLKDYFVVDIIIIEDLLVEKCEKLFLLLVKLNFRLQYFFIQSNFSHISYQMNTMLKVNVFNLLKSYTTEK